MTAKPKKPYKQFPLYPHASGQWAKTIRGKDHYFGVWADRQAAFDRYMREKDALFAGADPSTWTGDATLADLCNAFMESKDRLLKIDELAKSTFDDYQETADRMCAFWNKTRPLKSIRAIEFDRLREHLGQSLGPVALGNEVNRVRMFFKFGYVTEIIEAPPRFSPSFKRPSKRIIRLEAQKKPKKLFTAKEIQRILANAGTPMRQIILLGINCALGNTDIGRLEWRHIDMRGGWMTYPRHKTGVPRRAKLWPQTKAAIKELPRSGQFVFVTKYGGSWTKTTKDNPIAKEFAKISRKARARKNGRGFYSLRHTFATVASESKDQPAVDYIMGHDPNTMSAHYRHAISDKRVRDVCDFVGNWLAAVVPTVVAKKDDSENAT